MLAVERRKRIKEIVAYNKSGTVLELAKLLGVTEETIRRDLSMLEKEGFLVRTHGGAFIKDSAQTEATFQFREQIYKENKQRIAQKCRNLISDGDTVFFDASTTAASVSEAVKDKEITVITNSLKILNQLCGCTNIRLFSTGGSLSMKSMSFVGRNACANLQQYHVDKAFVSCDSLHIIYGLTDSSERQADIRQTAIEHSQEVYMIVDYTKFDKAAFIKIADFSQITAIVTDEELSPKWKTFCAKKGISVY